MMGDVLGITAWKELLVSTGGRPGTLLKTLPCPTGQHTTLRIVSPQYVNSAKTEKLTSKLTLHKVVKIVICYIIKQLCTKYHAMNQGHKIG